MLIRVSKKVEKGKIIVTSRDDNFKIGGCLHGYKIQMFNNSIKIIDDKTTIETIIHIFQNVYIAKTKESIYIIYVKDKCTNFSEENYFVISKKRPKIGKRVMAIDGKIYHFFLREPTFIQYTPIIIECEKITGNLFLAKSKYDNYLVIVE